MVNIEEVQLDIQLPTNEIGMVIMQPYVELTGNEPFKWQPDKKNAQIEKILKTLEISKTVNHGLDKIHFTIFPEYSIPGIEGVQSIHDVLLNEEWKNGTIIIGGVDGLTKDEYTDLLSNGNTLVNEANLADKVSNDSWINCCITWIKSADGELKR